MNSALPRFALAFFATLATISLASAQAIVEPSRTAAAVGATSSQGGLLRDDVGNAASNTLNQENGFAPVSPGDQDIGQQLILKRNDRVYPWHIWLDNSVFWTDNAANVHSGKQADAFWVGGVSAGYQPKLFSRVYLDINVGEHFFEYDKLKELNFQSTEGSAGFIVLTPEVWNTLWYANYYYQRLTQDLRDKPIYAANDIRVGGQKTIQIDRLNTLNFGIQAAFSVDTEPLTLRRHEFSFAAGYNFKIMQELTLALTYRFIYYDYFEFPDRHDFFNNFGASLVYQPWPWLEVSANYNFTVNRSNIEDFSYDAQLTGPSLILKAKF